MAMTMKKHTKTNIQRQIQEPTVMKRLGARLAKSATAHIMKLTIYDNDNDKDAHNDTHKDKYKDKCRN